MFNKLKDIIAILFNKDAVVVSRKKVTTIINNNTILSIENKLARDRINSLDEEDRERELLIERIKKLEHDIKLISSLESLYIKRIQYLELKLHASKAPTFSKFVKDNPMKNPIPAKYEPYKPRHKNDDNVFISKVTISEIIRVVQDDGGIDAIRHKLSVYA